MKVGYSFWGFQSDYRLNAEFKSVSAPDGCWLYVWAIFEELLKRGHEVYSMMPNKDVHSVSSLGLSEAFGVFATDRRIDAYTKVNYLPYKIQGDPQSGEPEAWPELDVLVLEWRWPIPGRNTEADIGAPYFQSDLELQKAMIRHYSQKNTRIIVSDQDYKLELEIGTSPHGVLDWGHKWGGERGFHVDVPFDLSLIPEPDSRDVMLDLVYVGSRYERDDMIDTLVAPVAEFLPTFFFGNWLEAGRDSDKRWPTICFPSQHRITNHEFRDVMLIAGASPLLAKTDYCKHGLMTGRILECLLFGVVPIGFSDFVGIYGYLPQTLIAKSSEDLMRIANSCKDRDFRREALSETLSKLRLSDRFSSCAWVDTLLAASSYSS